MIVLGNKLISPYPEKIGTELKELKSNKSIDLTFQMLYLKEQYQALSRWF